MPEPVALDIAAMSALVDRLTRAGDDLSGIEIPAPDALPGSALGNLELPGRVTAEVRRLGTAVQEWVCSGRRSIDELAAADGAGAQRFPPR